VYVGSGDRKVYCLNATTGGFLWSYLAEYAMLSSPAVSNGRVYVGNGDRKLYCLNATTGRHLWNYTTGNPVLSSPAVADGHVYVGSSDRKVYCLNATTGGRIWSYTTGLNVESSPAVASGRVYVGSDDAKVYCLNATTGGSLWSYATGDSISSSPAVAGGRVYVGSDDYQVHCINATTGWGLWSYPTGNSVSSSPAVAGGRVYVGSSDYKVYCLPNILNTTSYTWPYSTGTNVSSVAISSDGQYIAAGNLGPYGKVYLFQSNHSMPLWSYSVLNGGVSSVAISGNGQYIVAGSSCLNSRVHFFQCSSATPLGTYSGGAGVCSVAISSDGQYFVDGNYYNSDVDYLGAHLFSRSAVIQKYLGGYNIKSVAIYGTSGEQYVVAGSASGYIFLLQRFDNAPVWGYSTGSNVGCVAFSSDGRYITAGSDNKNIYLFQRSSSTPLWSYSTNGSVKSIAISSDGQYIIAGSDDKSVYLFQYNSSTPLWSYSTNGSVRSVAISSDGEYITAGSDDTKVYFFQRSSSMPLNAYSTGGSVRSVAISGNGQYIAAGSSDGKIYFFNVSDIESLTPYYTAVVESADPLELGSTEIITITGVGDFSGIQTVQIAFEGSNHTMTNLGEGTWRYNMWTPSMIGDYSYMIYLQNNKGSWRAANGSIQVIASTPPTYMSLIESADPLEFGGTETITITGVADLSGIQTVLIAFEGNNHTLTNLGGGTWHYNTWIPSTVGDYPYTIYMQDNLGYWNMTSNVIQVVNATGPTYISVTENANPLQLGSTEIITITGVADLSGIQTVLIAFEETNHTMTNLGGGTWHYNTWAPSTVGDYPYTIYIRDNIGHWNATSGLIRVIDTIPPIYTSVTESFDPLELGSTEIITISSVADPSGIQTVLLACEGSNHTMTNLGGGTWRYNTWAPSTVGNYSYTVFIQDTIGNWNMSSGTIQVVNATPPIYLSITESADPLELGSTEMITIIGVADLSGVQTVLLACEGSNHTMTSLGSGSWRYNMWAPSMVGDYPYTIYMQDNLGNWNMTSNTIQVVDTTPPTYTSVTESADPLELGNMEAITIVGVADLSGIQTVLVAFEGNNHTMTNLVGDTWCYITWTPNSKGNYLYTIYVQDNNGNWNVTSGFIQVIDAPPPTLDILTVLAPFIWLLALIIIGNVILTFTLYRRQTKKIQLLSRLVSTLKSDPHKKSKSQ